MLTGHINDTIFDWYPEALKELLHIFKTTDFQSIETGRHIVKGDDIFFMVQDYETRKADEARPEDHQIYVDVQFVFTGEEQFGVTLSHDNLQQDTPYNPEDDIRFYKPTCSYDRLHFKKGMYIVLWPQDIHVPGLDMDDGSRKVRKIVGKIKVDLLKA